MKAYFVVHLVGVKDISPLSVPGFLAGVREYASLKQAFADMLNAETNELWIPQTDTTHYSIELVEFDVDGSAPMTKLVINDPFPNNELKQKEKDELILAHISRLKEENNEQRKTRKV